MISETQKKIILKMAECNMNISETARRMYFAKSTIGYHCGEIKNKTGLTPNNFYDLVELLKIVKQEGMENES